MKKIIKIEVFGLFGDTNHSITIGADKDFSIIYGPNGVGKTKVLEISKHLSAGDSEDLVLADFQKAIITYDNGAQLSATKNELEKSQFIPHIFYEIQYVYSEPNQPSIVFKDSEKADTANWIENNTSWNYVGGDRWQDPDDGEIRKTDEVQRFYDPRIFRNSRDHKVKNVDKEKFNNIFNKGSIHLIDTQRLRAKIIEESSKNRRFIKPENIEVYSTRIQDLSQQMKHLISVAQTEHSIKSQELDRRFPSEVLSHISNSQEDSLRSIYQQQSIFRSRLASVVSDHTLNSTIELPSEKLEQWQINFLDRYLNDADKKLESFKSLIEKIELLEEVINSRLNRKFIKISSKDGITVHHQTSPERTIQPEDLSSGEQHEIILFFDLLFNVKENCLVLIDEPEISLHVAWQRKFIPDVNKLAKISNFRFLIATHSPQIMGSYIDEAQRLGSPEDPWED